MIHWSAKRIYSFKVDGFQLKNLLIDNFPNSLGLTTNKALNYQNYCEVHSLFESYVFPFYDFIFVFFVIFLHFNWVFKNCILCSLWRKIFILEQTLFWLYLFLSFHFRQIVIIFSFLRHLIWFFESRLTWINGFLFIALMAIYGI